MPTFLRAAFKAALIYAAAAWFMGPIAPAQKRVDYRYVPKLQKIGNDTRTMGDAFKQLAFNVMVPAAIFATLLTHDNAVEPGDTAIFLYAGHGFEIAEQNCLLPKGVPRPRGEEDLVRHASVVADRIIERLQSPVLVFDTVATIPFEHSGRVPAARRAPR